MHNPFRYFNSSPDVIRLTVMMYIRYPLSLRQVEDLLAERGIDICHETVRFWWNRFGPMFAAEIRKRRVHHSERRLQDQRRLSEPLPPRRGSSPGRYEFATYYIKDNREDAACLK
jgi:putative transposase